MKKLESFKSFAGSQEVWQHQSKSLDCSMRFAIYLPPQIDKQKCPVLYFLSGLTCTEQNFITKGHAQQMAAEYGMIVVAPDTSPRGESIPNDEAYDLGQGAGFYLNATQEPWAKNYRMYDYIVHELPELIESHFPASEQRSICGHSMGGHGALCIALRNPGNYQSVSAFSPIVAPCQVPWGQKAFTAYLGTDQHQWQEWDSCQLVAQAEEKLPLLVDQGLVDNFLEEQLQPQLLEEACEKAGHPCTIRRHEGYDHSYYFIASFIGGHLKHHAEALGLIS